MQRKIYRLALAASLLTALSVAAPAGAGPDPWLEPDRQLAPETCDGGGGRGDHGGRGERGERHSGDHDRWDYERHNGYYFHERWYYGPPPPAYFRDPGYEPGYSAWRRGAALPPFYRGYVVADPQRYRLRPPPRGFIWYRVGDAFLLTDMASGVIFEIVPY